MTLDEYDVPSTPILTGKSAERFDRIVAENSRKPPRRLVPTELDMDRIHRIREQVLRKLGYLK